MNYRTLCSRFIKRLLPVLLCSTQALLAAPFGYTTNRQDGTVSVIDTATNTVVAMPMVSGDPVGIAVMPDGSKVYVTQTQGAVVVIDAATNTIVGSPIPVGASPQSIAILPNGTKAYVGNFSGDSVSVIDTVTNTVIGSPIPVGAGPKSIAITPDGSKAYVTNSIDDDVVIIDTATDTVIGSPIGVGLAPFGIAVTPDGTKVYVCNSNSGTVSVIDTSTNLVIATIPAISETDAPQCVAITPNGAKAYVTVDHPPAANSSISLRKDPPSAQNSVIVIDTVTNTVIGTPIPVGFNPIGVAITPDGSRAYVCIGDSTVVVIDTTTDSIIDSPIPVGLFPYLIAIGPLAEQPQPPSHFKGIIKRHIHSYWRKTTLYMKWKKSPSSNIDHYEILASGRVIASIQASGPLKFHKRLQPYVLDERLSHDYLHYLKDKYRIRAVTSDGLMSSLKKLKIEDIYYKGGLDKEIFG